MSRRALWEVLLERKATTAIMLVTHFIDEADILADQVTNFWPGLQNQKVSDGGESPEMTNSISRTIPMKHESPLTHFRRSQTEGASASQSSHLALQVAIMAEGEIASAGSSWQLKQQYSNG